MNEQHHLNEWAQRWAIPQAALDELARLTIHAPELDESISEKTEAYSQSQVRLEAPHFGVHLFRNNVGAGKIVLEGNVTSRFMRWGLGNDSPAINKRYKSGDLIGIRKRLITANLVGTYIGQFISRENKRPNWKFNPNDERDVAQLAWATFVNSQGGDAKIVTGPGSFT